MGKLTKTRPPSRPTPLFELPASAKAPARLGCHRVERTPALPLFNTYRLQLPPATSALGDALTLTKRVDEALPLLEQAVKAAVEMGLASTVVTDGPTMPASNSAAVASLGVGRNLLLTITSPSIRAGRTGPR